MGSKTQPIIPSPSPVPPHAAKHNTYPFAICMGSPIPIWLANSSDLSIVEANHAAASSFGYSRADLAGMSLGRLCPSADLQAVQASGSTLTSIRSAHGHDIPVRLSSHHVTLGDLDLLFIAAQPLAEQAALATRADEAEALLLLAQVAAIVVDADGRVLLWNNRATDLYGWTTEEAIGNTITSLYCSEPGLFERGHEAVAAHGEWSAECRMVTKKGTPVSVHTRWAATFDESGALRRIVLTDLDQTERKTMEEQALRSQRLESIGTLASGIAHDLNNILTPILMSVGILRTRPIDSESMKLIAAIESSAERGAGIVRQVLTFARGVAGDRMLLQPRHLLNDLAKILGQTFPKNIAIRTQVPRDLWMIMGDATQIHQVLLNLCLNARDAMPDGGNLLLVADNVAFDGSTGGIGAPTSQGPYVMLQVTDTGSGITPDIVARMFDPFFTTKEPGRGTGLGLSTARGIVKNHGGFMTVDTQPGRGTTFKVFIPASLNSQLLEEHDKPAVPRGHGEIILVVDDEAPVRAAATRTLESHGYQVYTAEDGADALALYFQCRKEIRLVLTDYTMEQMDGLQLVQALKRLDPDCPIVVSSGQCNEEKIAAFRARGVESFLDKPYKPEQLLLCVHRELARAAKA